METYYKAINWMPSKMSSTNQLGEKTDEQFLARYVFLPNDLDDCLSNKRKTWSEKLYGLTLLDTMQSEISSSLAQTSTPWGSCFSQYPIYGKAILPSIFSTWILLRLKKFSNDQYQLYSTKRRRDCQRNSTPTAAHFEKKVASVFETFLFYSGFFNFTISVTTTSQRCRNH